jgi:hypothetical protein
VESGAAESAVDSGRVKNYLESKLTVSKFKELKIVLWMGDERRGAFSNLTHTTAPPHDP